MDRSLSIAAYLANLGSGDRRATLARQPPRPKGTIIWARCCDRDQLTAIETLERKLSLEGDPIHIVATLVDWQMADAKRALPEPYGKAAIQDFIAHWQPVMSIWVKGDLDPALMAEMRSAGILSILVDANAEGLDGNTALWVPGALRSLLTQFEAVLTLDETSAERLIRAGAPDQAVIVTGAMEDCAPTLPYSEAERTELAQSIGTRPVWLTAGATYAEWHAVCTAQQIASRTAHRLLSIVVPAKVEDAPSMARNIRQLGFQVALRSEEYEPDEVTQIYIVDTDEELGLWYSISPITYIGGTLQGQSCRDPFEAATAGSAVLYGPHVAPYQRHAARLQAADASRSLRAPAELGPAVEGLLASDKAAELAHRAWAVTSSGANVTNRIAAFIQLRLEEMAV
ncbi:MAG: 3-deoxy-D-manno-octulosonic acid transferase [Yoonia sp.]|uniref:3-deoxy-D-manno-octulosonic acid transferase n=1 Tax=Yoonia sp. TaxID=2212373 RepID=UPI003EF18EFD